MASRTIRHAVTASAAVVVTSFGAATSAVALPAGANNAAPSGIISVSGGSGVAPRVTAPPTRRRATPQLAPRRTVLHQHEALVFVGSAEPGSTVQLSAVRDQGWAFITAPVTVPRSGKVRVGVPLRATGTHLVRADVRTADRSIRYGFGPYVVTVAPRGRRLPTYVTYSLADLLRSGKVTASATSGEPITVGGDPFAYDAAGRGPAYPDWNPAVTADHLGCISANVQFAVADGDAGSALVRVNNRWAGRGALSSTRAGTVGTVVTPMDGGRFTIDVAGGTKAYLRGTFTCPKGALNR